MSSKEEKSVQHYHTRIQDLPDDERPRERLEHYGPTTLSSTELLAIILRVGTAGHSAIRLAEDLLSQFHGLSGLAKADFGQLRAQNGIGPAKAAQIQAALELGRRLLSSTPVEQPAIHSPRDTANLLTDMRFLEQEEVRLLLLDNRHRVIRQDTLYRGSLNQASIRIAEVFRSAIRENSKAIILVHNHPSGNPTPSPDDVQVTRTIVAAGKLLDIELLDHIVIGNPNFVSLKERRLGF